MRAGKAVTATRFRSIFGQCRTTSPDFSVMPLPGEATTCVTVGIVVSICAPTQARGPKASRGWRQCRRHFDRSRALRLIVVAARSRRRSGQRQPCSQGQRIRAGAAGVGCCRAVVEGQRRDTARYRYRLAHVERQGDYVFPAFEIDHSTAVIRVTDAVAVGVVVSICSVAPDGAVTAPVRLAALPAPSLTVPPLRLAAVTVRSAVF